MFEFKTAQVLPPRFSRFKDKYRFNEMAVDQYFEFVTAKTYKDTPNGKVEVFKEYNRYRAAAAKYCKDHPGVKFAFRTLEEYPTGRKMICQRVA